MSEEISEEQIAKIQLQLPCGALYYGHVDGENKPFRYGQVLSPMRLAGGEMYVGELSYGIPTRNGTVIYVTGLCFTGNFEYGQARCGVVSDSHNTPLSGNHTNVPYLGTLSYSGQYIGGKREGCGELTNSDGFSFHVLYCNDVLQQTLSCGAHYEGDVDEEGMPEGHGKVTTPMPLRSGVMYVGELRDGYPHGLGSLTYVSGFKFTGDIYDGCSECGIVTGSDDIKLSGYYDDVPYFGYGSFSGFFYRGRRNGQGLMAFSDGKTQEGNFSGDKKNGTFLVTDKNGKKNEEVYAEDELCAKKEAGAVELEQAGQRREVGEVKKELWRMSEKVRRVNGKLVQKIEQRDVKVLENGYRQNKVRPTRDMFKEITLTCMSTLENWHFE